MTRLAGGVAGIAAVAEASDRVVLSAELLPAAETLEAEATLRALRKKKKVSAILHEAYPVRYWDHDLGPAEPHLLALDLSALADTIAAVTEESDERAPDEAVEEGGDAGTPYPATLPRPVDLTPKPGRTADIAGAALTPGRRHPDRRDADAGDPRRAVRARLDRRRDRRSRHPVRRARRRLRSAGRQPRRHAAGVPARRAQHAGRPHRLRAVGRRHRRIRPAAHRRRLGPLGDELRVRRRRFRAHRDRRLRRPRSGLPPSARRLGARAAHARRLHLHARRGRSHFERPGRPALELGDPAAPGAHLRRRHRHSAGHPGACPDGARHDHRGRDDRRGRRAGARVAAAAGGRDGCRARAAAAVDPRRAAEQLERVELAVGAAARGRAGLCRAAARPRPVDGVRAGVHRPRLEQLGRRSPTPT